MRELTRAFPLGPYRFLLQYLHEDDDDRRWSEWRTMDFSEMISEGHFDMDDLFETIIEDDKMIWPNGFKLSGVELFHMSMSAPKPKVQFSPTDDPMKFGVSVQESFGEPQ